MRRFEIMSEEEARKIVDYTRRAIVANLAGGIHSADPKVRAEARLISLQVETWDDRMAAKRRLMSVTDDMTAEQYRIYLSEKRKRLADEMAAAARRRRRQDGTP